MADFTGSMTAETCASSLVSWPFGLRQLVSLPPSTSAWGDALEPDQRSYPRFPAAWAYSSNQILVGQPPAGCAVGEAVQPQQSMPSDVAIIEPEGELVNVPTKMLRADVVEGAIDTAFQHCPNAFDAVGCNAVASVARMIRQQFAFCRWPGRTPIETALKDRLDRP